ncbi:GntR family transcriptional regulator [Frigidibacter sp. MR17.14]|uniref:GntR family transcriptional regulator n=1 Tax=Frigidibacter sp. MR17.14 TaxID=3126509 RepID=UPI003012FE71
MDSKRQQIIGSLSERINSGRLKPGERLGSESELMAEFGVSRMTVHHAMRELEARGFLERRKGSGSYVAPARPYVAIYPHLDIRAEIEAAGGVHRARVLVQALELAAPPLAQGFGLGADAPLFHAVVLHLSGGVPVEIEDRWLNPALLPECMSVDLTRETLFGLLMARRPFRAGDERIRACTASDEEAAVLGLEPGAVCLETTRRTRSDEGVVTQVRLLRPGTSHLEGRIAPAARD